MWEFSKKVVERGKESEGETQKKRKEKGGTGFGFGAAHSGRDHSHGLYGNARKSS